MKTIFSNIFLDPFSLSSSETPIMRMLVHLMLSQRTLRLTSVFFLFFSYTLFYSSDLHILSSRSLICSSASVILLLIPSSVLFISVLFVQFSQVFRKHFLYLLHFFPKILNHLHYHYFELFSWTQLHFIQLFFWGFILFFHLGDNSLPFHFS